MDIVNNMFENAQYLIKYMQDRGRLDLLGEAKCIPVVVVKFKKKQDFTVYDASNKLREKGWIVPAYTLPPNAEDVAVLRVVVKENFSREMAEALAEDATNACIELEKSGFKGAAAPVQKAWK